ncbi:MAG: IMP dehydrogenase [Deltaproteobacteria bacterium]|nr:IMP dehydrogenase [Deltaproteobacteria bacterium]
MLPTDPPIGLTFDDVLLVPGPSSVLPGEVDLATRLAPGLTLRLPFLSAAMDTVTESAMAIAMAQLGGLGVIHRNLTPDHQAEEVRIVVAHGLMAAAAVGAGDEALVRARLLTGAGASALFVDTAHGHSARVLETVRELARAHPGVLIAAGNVATGDGALALAEAGAHVVKVGVGPGSICTTRVVAGVGVPQLTAIADAARALSGSAVTVIADGGIRASGDIVKAIAAGAHGVMLGGMLAGTDAAPGEVFEQGGRQWKRYRGMGSLGAMVAGAGARDRYFQGKTNDADKLVPEGVEAAVPFRGAISAVIHQLAGGLKAGMGYVGAATIEALRRYDRFVRITPAGLGESHVHDVMMTAEAPNYRR